MVLNCVGCLEFDHNLHHRDCSWTYSNVYRGSIKSKNSIPRIVRYLDIQMYESVFMIFSEYSPADNNILTLYESNIAYLCLFKNATYEVETQSLLTFYVSTSLCRV